MRAAGWPTVKGNADVWITGDPQTVEDPKERENFEAIAAARAILERARYGALATLEPEGGGHPMATRVGSVTAIGSPRGWPLAAC